MVFSFFANALSRPAGGWLAGALAALLAASPAASAQTRPADTLTTRAHRLPEARVRAVRPERFAVGSQRVELDSAVLAQYRGGTAADVLGSRLGLYLKNYGPGQLATISLRGTSAQHTAVLWNGLNIALPTLGQNDLALLPISGNTQLAVQAGPAAALYGSGAVGGAILLRTEPDWRPGLRGSVQADAGSFGLRGGSLEARTASSTLAVRVAGSYRQAQNDYPYYLRQPTGLVRYTMQNAALRHQWSFSPDLAWRVGAAGELTAAVWLTDADREIQQGTSIAGSNAREIDQSRRLVLGYRRATTGGGQWAVRGAWFEDIINYSDQGAVSNSRVRTTQSQAEYTAPLGQRASLRVGAEAQHFAALVDGYGSEPITENRAAAFALLRYDPRPGLRLSANLRQAALPAGLAPLTPTVGLEWDVLRPASPPDSLAPAPGLTLKASAARTYRAPTLNERYWQPGGNPDLLAESGHGFEAGLRHRLGLASHVVLESELTAFTQLVDNWVQWLPLGPGGIYSPRNLRQVRSQGLEASTALRLRQGRYQAAARLAYALTQTQKTQGVAADTDPVGIQLAYVPLHRANITTDHQWRGWLASAAYTFTSYVYTDASGSDFLPSGGLLGATLGRTVALPGRTSLTLLVQSTNLLNRSYESYPTRPGPPRAFSVSLRLNYK
ncbi:TonB-dependent receptor plug domain-containing protein [Hymenobacter ginsengisoli]|uniref:TonB-dependent receptor plug domain-containing protein n=1 Tax=Hymenobacter ginsengisoli TaxID=1051626 RepID=A0ABP8QL53_9BACT|nr:TonB-dependent receptor [Hymenobacter sp. BT559]